jgi:hypothetical protein
MIDYVIKYQQIISFIDMEYLHMLVIDLLAIEEADWLRQSTITELHYHAFQNDPFGDWDQYYVPKLNIILVKAL